MVTYMNDKKIQNLDDIRAFLKGTTDISGNKPGTFSAQVDAASRGKSTANR